MPAQAWNSLVDSYGGKRAAIAALWYRTHGRFGRFARYRHVDWSRVSRIVFLCKGNICRSPYAERYAESLGVSSTSGGLWADAGKPANATAVGVAHALGIDLSTHRSRTLDQLTLSPKDLVVAFEPLHLATFSSRESVPSGLQTTLLGLWSRQERWVYMHDPYGLPEGYFRACFDRINEGVRGLLSGR
jgi:protein-tyrosine phosphatase